MALRRGLAGTDPLRLGAACLGQLRVIQEKAAPSLGSQAGPWPVITSAVQLCDPKVQVVVRDEIAMGLRQLNDRPGGRALAQLNLQGLAPADEGEKAVELATGHSLRRSAEKRGLTLCIKRRSGAFAQKHEEERWLGSLSVLGWLPPVAVLVLGGEAAQARPCSTFRTGEGGHAVLPQRGETVQAQEAPAWRSSQQDRLLSSADPRCRERIGAGPHRSPEAGSHCGFPLISLRW